MSSAESSASSFVTQHRVALAITAVVGIGSIAGLLYHFRQQQLEQQQNGNKDVNGGAVSKSSKKKKSKKKKKGGKKEPEAEKDLPYPVGKNGVPEVNSVAVSKLSADDKAKWASALKEKGNEFFKGKEYKTAIDYYSKALICKEDPVFYSNRSACYSALGDNESTIEDTTKALKIDPGYTKCLLRRARAYENLENYPEAMFDLTALTIYGGMSDVSNESMLERILKKHAAKINEEKYSDLPKVLPSSSSLSSFFGAFSPETIDLDASHYEEGSGEKYLVEGLNKMKLDTSDGYKEADVLLNQAVSQFDKSIEGIDNKTVALGYEYAGAFAFLKADSDKGLEYLEKALSESARPRTYVIMGLIKADKGDYVGADADFNKGIKLLPDDPDIYYHYGQIFYLVGDLAKAQANFEKAKVLNPNNVYSYIQLACLAYRQGDSKKCDTLFKEAKSKFPTSAEVPNYYGEILFDRQDFDGALKQFETAARLQEAHQTFNIGALPLINQSAIYQRKGEMDECVKILQKACELDPKSEVARLNLGQVYLAQQKVDDAIKLFEEACLLARSPDDRTQAISLMEASKMQQKIRQDPVLSKKVQEILSSIPQAAQ
ncbi:DEKNAAC105603 [Brettanomyces naardenensis]|uniref:DEKNAAC105603 n=1 Tax=Brettanomyces naardenensis TaxID=13370 RepID=A0A448YTU0_BRENA|nr:DEKNAAC105603 [Brettanomyces naardenensis]